MEKESREEKNKKFWDKVDKETDFLAKPMYYIYKIGIIFWLIVGILLSLVLCNAVLI